MLTLSMKNYFTYKSRTIFSVLIVLLSIFFCGSCTNSIKSNELVTSKKEIDNYIKNVMQLHNIPGLALAVINENEVIYKGYFGKSSIEDDLDVGEKTIFRIFSATKLITSTGVFQLIEDEKINLEDEISLYIVNLPLKWKKIKIKNLLSHSSGLPDLIKYKSDLSDDILMDKLALDEMDFVTGEQFRYNQTNYWLLSKIIEKVTGLTFDQFILSRQFSNDKSGVLFSSNSQQNILNRANRYYYSYKSNNFVKDKLNAGKRGHSGNGLNISLNRFVEWNQKFNENKILNSKTKQLLFTPFKFFNQKDVFLHGWGVYQVGNTNSYGFSGGNLASFRKFTKNNITIIMLSNGYQIPAYDIVVNDIAKLIIPDLKGKGLIFEEDVMKAIMNNNFEKASHLYKTLKNENPHSKFDNLKWNINSIGNSYQWAKEIKRATQVFRFNSDLNSKWWVSSASLAEIYEIQGDFANAIINFNKAIILNKQNEWGYNSIMKSKIIELNKG